jgi:uncharacterized membrane protein
MVAAVEDWALFLHLFGAFLLVSGAVVAGMAFEAARRRRRPAEIAALLGLSRIGVLLVGIGSSLVVPFGLWLVHLGRWGYGSGWIDAALALFVVMAALGAAGGQRPKRARLLAERLAREDAPESADLRALLDDRVARALNYTSAALLLAIVALMVFKP